MYIKYESYNNIKIERKRNIFKKLFSTHSRKENHKKGIEIKYIVSYPSNPSIPCKQESQSSIVSSGNFQNKSNNSVNSVSRDKNIEISTSPNPSNFSLNCSNNENSGEKANITTDSVTEKKISTTKVQKGTSNNHKKVSKYYNPNTMVYKETRTHEHIKNYLKSLANGRKNSKSFISVTSTSSPTSTNANTKAYHKNFSHPNISSISNASSTFSIHSLSQISQSQLHPVEIPNQSGNSPKLNKDHKSLTKTHSDRRLALDKIMGKIRKVQSQHNIQHNNKSNDSFKLEKESSDKNTKNSMEVDKSVGKVSDRNTKSKSKLGQNDLSIFHINKYFSINSGKGKSNKNNNQNQSHNPQKVKYMRTNSAKINSYPNTVSYFSKGHEMIPRHKNISVHSNYNKIASIDISNSQLNDEKFYSIKKASSSQHMNKLSHNVSSSTSSNFEFEVNFNSDDTLINSQYLNNTQTITSESYNSIKKSNSSIYNTQEQLKELENSLQNLNLDKFNSNTLTNLNNTNILFHKTSSNTNLGKSISSSRTHSNANLQMGSSKSKSSSRTHSNLNLQVGSTKSKASSRNQSYGNLQQISSFNNNTNTSTNTNSNTNSNPNCTTSSNTNSNINTITNSNPKSIEYRRPKNNAVSSNNLIINNNPKEMCRSPDSSELNIPFCGSPPTCGKVKYEPSISGKSDKGSRSISVSFALNTTKKTRRNRIGAFSLKNFITTETIEENSDEESCWNENFEVENDCSNTDFSRKPKSMFNESVYSYSSSVNQIRNDLKMEKFRNKTKYFTNLFGKDRDIFLGEKLRKKMEELNNNKNNKSKHSSNHKGNSNYACSIKETDSIYLKTEEDSLVERKVNQYHFINEIDSGSYGHVFTVYDENINKYFACKVISKSKLKRNFRFTQVARRRNITPMSNGGNSQEDDPFDQIKREVAIFKKMTKHPNIASLVEVLDDAKDDNIYMVFELCEKGKIMDIRVNERVEPFSEEKARKYFRDIVLGLEYCHYKKIIHRDIKPENLLLTADDKVKITDFGISYMFNENQDDANIFDKNASPLFCPPEACSTERKSMKGKAVDIWALGATLYSFVHGYCPFEDNNIINLCKKIEEDPVVYSPTITDSLKDLLSKMLQKDPDKRITLPEIKEHPWVTENGTNPMLSTEKNCIYEEINDEEIQNAIQPAFKFVSKLLKKIRKGISTKNEKDKNSPNRHYSLSVNSNSLPDHEHRQRSYSQKTGF